MSDAPREGSGAVPGGERSCRRRKGRRGREELGERAGRWPGRRGAVLSVPAIFRIFTVKSGV